VFLLWEHWTKALVWFDDIDISALVSACVLVCRRENVGD